MDGPSERCVYVYAYVCAASTRESERLEACSTRRKKKKKKEKEID